MNGRKNERTKRWNGFEMHTQEAKQKKNKIKKKYMGNISASAHTSYSLSTIHYITTDLNIDQMIGLTDNHSDITRE